MTFPRQISEPEQDPLPIEETEVPPAPWEGTEGLPDAVLSSREEK